MNRFKTVSKQSFVQFSKRLTSQQEGSHRANKSPSGNVSTNEMVIFGHMVITNNMWGLKVCMLKVIRCVYNDCAERKRMDAELWGEKDKV